MVRIIRVNINQDNGLNMHSYAVGTDANGQLWAQPPNGNATAIDSVETCCITDGEDFVWNIVNDNWVHNTRIGCVVHAD